MSKPYYQDRFATLYHGNSLQILPDIGGIALSIADPPYGETRFEWDRWPTGWPGVVATVCNQLWCFGSFRLFLERYAEFGGWDLAQEIVWEKHNGTALHNDRFRKVHELIAHFYRGKWSRATHNPVFTYDAEQRSVVRQNKPSHWGQLRSAGRFDVRRGGPRLVRSVLYAKSCHRRALHPTQKPEAIIAPLISYSTNPGDLVADWFAGSGTVAVVAKALGRRSVSVEADERYCERAATRLSRLSPKIDAACMVDRRAPR